jgi:hypothetical protein
VLRAPGIGEDMPPLRLLLVLDNLSGNHTPSFVMWLCEQGIMPLYTSLGGSWLNMSESIQRILKRRALDGEHPTTPQHIIDWLEETAEGWNADPTPSCGEANAKGGATEREFDDMLWAVVEPTVAAHFAVGALGLNKGQGRDKWPTRASGTSANT